MGTRYRQDPPFCIQVEMTEGCNLYCNFCGLQNIRSGPGAPFKFMTFKTAERVAQQIRNHEWTSRIEFAMHGEPSMNPEMTAIISVFRHWLPRNQLMITSNGGGFLKDTDEKIRAVFEAGLNILAFDDYQNVNIVPKIRGRIIHDIPVHDYPGDGLEWSPHRRWPIGTKQIIIIEDISRAEKGSHATINNHAGSAFAPNDSKQGQRCAKPFREMGIRWDGRVAGCCVDWPGKYKIGNVLVDDIDELWQSDRFMAMRKKLYHGMRDFGPCAGCDHPSYRVGLLPDKLGKKKLPKPNAADLEIIEQALSGRTFTVAVPRPWSKKK